MHPLGGIQPYIWWNQALAAYTTENNITQLTPNQLEITRKMVLVSSPGEEIPQHISKETAALSAIIPNIQAVLRFWEKQDHRI